MLSIREVQDVVATAIGGMQVTETVEGLERFPVNLRYPQDWRNSPEQLADLPVVTPSGAHIPLGAVAKIAIVDGPGMIRSENARRTGFVVHRHRRARPRLVRGRSAAGRGRARCRCRRATPSPGPASTSTWSGCRSG